VLTLQFILRGRQTGEVSVSIHDRGFASMSRERQHELSSKGGRAVHDKGTAHEWTVEEARQAGRKGMLAMARKRVGRGRARI
jgi:general stress protein YciG